jgi:murein DD-endopeptidase MepM/ murein hydrolase activator NlpD
MTFRYPLILIMILYLGGSVRAQQAFRQDYFDPPINIPMYLSGNFGELRSNHFHSGIDIKTQGVSGHRIFASAEGYISRIKVEAAGYGNTLYITHPAGYTTVYAHLDRFRKDIADYVKKVQYKEEKHALNIYPEKGTWMVEKGDFIAFSGSSGYSFGPHLHFEIRNAANQAPMNVLRFGFDITDDVAPRVLSVYLYPLGKNSHVNGSVEKQRFQVEADSAQYRLQDGLEVLANGRIGFGIEAFDYLNGARNRCGIYIIMMLVDGKLKYQWEMNQFAFSETRYINSYIDYEEKQVNGRLVQKTYLDPNNRLGLYEYVDDKGICDFSADREYQISFILEDAHANGTELFLTVRGGQSGSIPPSLPVNDPVRVFSWDEPNEFREEGVVLNIPEGGLYDDLDFTYQKSEALAGSCSPVHHIHHIHTPMHLSANLAIQPDSLPEELREKAYLGFLNGEDGKMEAAGGEWKDGMVRAKIRSFGRYTVMVDTVAPELRPLNLGSSRNMSAKPSMRFRTRDQQSGIKSYEGYIDNHWVLMEYDLKNDLVLYRFDPTRLERGKTHEFELYIIDNKDNIAYYYTEFYW